MGFNMKKISTIILASGFALGAISCARQTIPSAIFKAPQVRALSQSQEASPRLYDTAKDYLHWAEMDARRWDTSAKLVKIEGDRVDENGKSWEWSYYFTSPFQKKALKVTNRRTKQEVSKLFFGSKIYEFDWEYDSDKVMKILKEHGLKRFPVMEMKLEDRFDLEWEVRSWDGYFRVNAETGEVTKR